MPSVRIPYRRFGPTASPNYVHAWQKPVEPSDRPARILVRRTPEGTGRRRSGRSRGDRARAVSPSLPAPELRRSDRADAADLLAPWGMRWSFQWKAPLLI